MIAQEEFSYNDSPNRNTGMSRFHILYGMHPRGVYKLTNMGRQEMRSVGGEDFVVNIQEM